MLRTASVLAALTMVNGETFFKETFSDADWEKRWTKSTWKKEDNKDGKWEWTCGKWSVDCDAQKGIQTTEDMKFHAISAKLDKPLDYSSKNLVLQFTVKHEEHKYGFCGGGYIKLTAAGIDQSSFGGDTPYEIMFGPDLCSYDVEKIHLIFNNHETGSAQKYLEKKDQIKLDYDDKNEFTHLYTLILRPDGTYEVQFDQKEKASGKIADHWELPGEVEFIRDPEDPLQIPDPEAQQPDEWDEEVDGPYEHPVIDNPSPKMIPNPNYKKDDAYKAPALEHVGFELWTVNKGSIFDNIYVGDSIDEAKKMAEETWAKWKDGEKKAKEGSKEDKEDDKKGDDDKKDEM